MNMRRSGQSDRRRFAGRRLSSRALGVATVGAVAALLLSACGGPSASQTEAQNLTAGVAAQKAGDYKTATTDYNKVLAADPKNYRALYDLGDVEQFQHLNSAAEANYRAALALYPNFELAMYNLATLVSSSSPTEAEILYQQVIKLDPKNADAYFNLGYVLNGLGQKTQGQADIAKAIALDPSLKSRVASTATSG